MSQVRAIYLKQSLSRVAPSLLSLIILMLATLLLDLASPWPLKILIDNILGTELIPVNSLIGKFINPNNSFNQNALFMIIGYVLIYLTNHLLNYIQDILRYHTYQKISKESALHLMTNINKLNTSYLRNHEQGGIMYKLNNNSSAIADMIFDVIFPIFNSLIFFSSSLYILSRLEPSMTLVALGSLPLIITFLYLLNPKIESQNQEVQLLNNKLFGFIETILDQILQIRIYLRTSHYLNKFRQHWQSTLESEERLYKTTANLGLFNNLIIVGSYALIIWIGITKIQTGFITTGILIIFLAYYESLINPVIQTIDSITVLREHISRLRTTDELLNPSNQISDQGKLSTIKDFTLTLKDINLKYNATPILKNVSLEFKPNNLYFLIGDSGSGKSSLINLITRSTEAPQSGSITLGSNKIEDYSLATLYDSLALVPQSNTLNNATILEAITFDQAQSYTMEQVEQACQLACLADHIDTLPQKYHTRVGEKGHNLSGGQIQRLLLARAILKDAKILLLDEVFSGQDAKTRQKLLTSLRNLAKTKTVIITTHNQELISPTDNVIFFKEGTAKFSQNSHIKKNTNRSKTT